MTATPGRDELLALATDLSNDKPGSRTRAVEMLRRLVAKPAEDGVREALKPFARAAKYAEEDEPDSATLFSSSARHEITLGHLRAAKRALSTTGEPKR